VTLPLSDPAGDSAVLPDLVPDTEYSVAVRKRLFDGKQSLLASANIFTGE